MFDCTAPCQGSRGDRQGTAPLLIGPHSHPASSTYEERGRDINTETGRESKREIEGENERDKERDRGENERKREE